MKRCLNCMEVYDEEYEVCPYCGHLRGTPPEVASHLMPGTVIAGRYIIGTVIGYGGFGVTYVGWDEELGIKTAIKEYYPNGLVNRSPGTSDVIVLGGERREQYFIGLKRFLEEARTMAKFSSNANIVHVYNFLEENNTAYIIMEHLEGVTLKGYLSQFENNRMPLEDAITVIKEVGKGLTTIHKGKIIHRDIAPDNIFICADGRIKLLDFGAARLSTGEKTQTLSVVLKPGYAPPEQYRSKSRQGPRTDVYALAATLYRMVTGILPVEALDRMVEDTLTKPSEINPELPQWIDSVVFTGMAKNAEVRFPSVEKFVAALNHEKEVNLPEKRIKLRRITRAASILIVAVLIGFGGYKNFGMYSDISGEGIPDGEISMLVPVTTVEDENRYNEFKTNFEKKFKGKVLNLEFIDAKEYEGVLNSRINSEAAPDIFMGNYLTAENEEAKASVNKILKDLEFRQLYLYKENKSLIEKNKALPVGYDAYVLYENTYLAQASGKSYAEEGGTDTSNLEKSSSEPNAKSKFLNEDITYYVGLVSEKSEIQKKLSGYTEVTSVTIDGESKGYFKDCLSINNNSSKQKQKIATLAVKYALNEEGQNILCVRNQGILPLNKKAFSVFKDVNESLAFIKPDKIKIS